MEQSEFKTYHIIDISIVKLFQIIAQFHHKPTVIIIHLVAWKMKKVVGKANRARAEHVNKVQPIWTKQLYPKLYPNFQAIVNLYKFLG